MEWCVSDWPDLALHVRSTDPEPASPSPAEYDWAPAIAMASVFGIFLLELIATRMGRSFLQKRGLKEHDPHKVRGNDAVGHTGHGTHAPPSGTATGLASAGAAPALAGAAGDSIETVKSRDAVVQQHQQGDLESGSEGKPHGHGHGHDGEDHDDELQESAVAQIIGVAILEAGVLFHSCVVPSFLASSLLHLCLSLRRCARC